MTGNIAHVDALREHYRAPSKVVLDKAIDHVDHGVAEFIAKSPLFVLATTSGAGTDASPRGGPPGFVSVLDRHRIAFGDLSGNNRLDSYPNLIEHPEVGLLFLVPGLDETLRVNGRGWVSDRLDLRERCPIDGRVPKLVVGIDVTGRDPQRSPLGRVRRHDVRTRRRRCRMRPAQPARGCI